MTELQERCHVYLASRTSDYEFRCIRYAAVLKKMLAIGFQFDHSVLDLGAGRKDFETYLRRQGWFGEYTPIDGSIDGTDLNTWCGTRYYDFIVAIEVVEHVYSPPRLMKEMVRLARHGVVITTPNCETVDVLGCDPTHVAIVPAYILECLGWQVERHNLFGRPNDSLLAYKKAPA